MDRGGDRPRGHPRWTPGATGEVRVHGGNCRGAPVKPAARSAACHRRRSARSGVTIIELTITLVILVIVWGGALSSQLAASDLVQTGRQTAIASTDLQSCMDRILLEPIDSVPIAGSPFEADLPIALFEELHLDSERIVPNYPGYVPGTEIPDPLTIVLTITWRDFDGRQRTMQLATLRTR